MARISRPGDGRRGGSWWRGPFLAHPIISGIISALIAAAIIAGFTALITWITSDKPETPEAKVAKLNTGQSVDYFREILKGEATTMRSPAKNWHEYLWMRKDYAVQAFTKSDRSVLILSVTTRSRNDFNPNIPILGGKLGSSSFYGVLKDGYEYGLNVRAFNSINGNWWYSEALTAVSSAQPRTWIMTASFVGRGDEADFELASTVQSMFQQGCESIIAGFCPYGTKISKVSQLRRKAVVTTYTILDPSLELNDLPLEYLQFGPTREDDVNSPR